MFEIFKATNGSFYWRLKGLNGEIVCHSEGYTTKQSALDGASAAKRIAANAQIKELV